MLVLGGLSIRDTREHLRLKGSCHNAGVRYCWTQEKPELTVGGTNRTRVERDERNTRSPTEDPWSLCPRFKELQSMFCLFGLANQVWMLALLGCRDDAMESDREREARQRRSTQCRTTHDIFSSNLQPAHTQACTPLTDTLAVLWGFVRLQTSTSNSLSLSAQHSTTAILVHMPHFPIPRPFHNGAVLHKHASTSTSPYTTSYLRPTTRWRRSLQSSRC